jgi:hypothetical protein
MFGIYSNGKQSERLDDNAKKMRDKRVLNNSLDLIKMISVVAILAAWNYLCIIYMPSFTSFALTSSVIIICLLFINSSKENKIIKA